MRRVGYSPTAILSPYFDYRQSFAKHRSFPRFPIQDRDRRNYVAGTSVLCNWERVSQNSRFGSSVCDDVYVVSHRYQFIGSDKNYSTSHRVTMQNDSCCP